MGETSSPPDIAGHSCLGSKLGFATPAIRAAITQHVEGVTLDKSTAVNYGQALQAAYSLFSASEAIEGRGKALLAGPGGFLVRGINLAFIPYLPAPKDKLI